MGRGPDILPKVQEWGRDREGERKKTSNQRGPKKSLKESFLLPSTISFLFCLHARLGATSWNVKCLMVTAGQKEASCRMDPGQRAGRRNGMTAIVKQPRWAVEAEGPAKGPFVIQDLPFSKARV